MEVSELAETHSSMAADLTLSMVVSGYLYSDSVFDFPMTQFRLSTFDGFDATIDLLDSKASDYRLFDYRINRQSKRLKQRVQQCWTVAMKAINWIKITHLSLFLS